MQQRINHQRRSNQLPSMGRESSRISNNPVLVGSITLPLLAFLLTCLLSPTLALACNCRCLVSLDPAHSGKQHPAQEVYSFPELPELEWDGCPFFGRRDKQEQCRQACSAAAAADTDRYTNDDWWCGTLNRPFDAEVTVYAQIGAWEWQTASKRRVQCTRCCDCPEGIYDPRRESCIQSTCCPTPGLPNGDKGGGYSALGGVLFQDIPGATDCRIISGPGPCAPPCSADAAVSCGPLAVTSSVNFEEGCDRLGAIHPKIELEVEGGTPPYTIRQLSGTTLPGLPTTGNSPFEFPGAPLGNYRLEVRDADGTIVTEEIVVEYEFSLTLSSTPASCPTCNNGTAHVSVHGGTSPFTYRWNDSQQQTDSQASGLAPGVYEVTVTDKGGCRRTGEVSVGWSPRDD